MANSREAQFKRDIIEAIAAYGWEVGIAGGCELTGEYFSELQLPHHRLTKREAERLRLEMAGEDCGRTSASYVRSGELHDPEKLHYAHGIADRIECDEAVMAQVRSHSEDQMMHGLLPNKVIDAVLDALSGHEKLSMPLLEREVSLQILKMLVGRSGQNGSQINEFSNFD
ncbi:hypothetical protein IOC61_12515 [Halomonas sp. KAO]|uniref:hypothetical protein n=1 Tax=Halomonas sp. KAO TaxID=2783858 RepID=UPI0018A03861|nr:hypothetical protein [Halomonas sp. KAO]MBF7054127.1 hypothetical protein [Halomonas sp. KAO]